MITETGSLLTTPLLLNVLHDKRGQAICSSHLATKHQLIIEVPFVLKCILLTKMYVIIQLSTKLLIKEKYGHPSYFLCIRFN